MRRSLLIGSDVDCDLRLDVPSVSRRHCRLTDEGTSIVLEDLNSRNGTFLNGERVSHDSRWTVSATDVVHLGSHRLDLAAALRRLAAADRIVEIEVLEFSGAEMVIGRGADCDLKIDLPMVSNRHARLCRVGHDVVVEDLGSANGTFVDGRAVLQPMVLPPDAVLSFGSATYRWKDVSTPPVAPSPWRRRTNVVMAGAIALIALPPFALAVVAGVAGTGSAAHLFAMTIAASAVGLIVGTVASVSVQESQLKIASRCRPCLAVSAALGYCLVSSLLVWWTAGLQGSWLPGAFLLWLASVVGVGVGWVASSVTPYRSGVRVAMTGGLIVVVGLLGSTSLATADSPWLSRLAAATPSRWTLEGLMLLEADQKGGDSEPANSLADRYFPATSERMGLAADVVALALMAIGLGGVGTWLAVTGPQGTTEGDSIEAGEG